MVTHRVFFPQFYASFIPPLLILPLQLFMAVSAIPLLCLCQSMARLFFTPLASFLLCILQSQGWKCLLHLLCLLLQRDPSVEQGLELGSHRSVLRVPFYSFSSELFLGLSLPRISIKHLSSACHWLFSASARHHWDFWLFFLCLFLVSVSQQIFACWKWGSEENWLFFLLCINLLEKTPLPSTVEWNNSWAGSLPLPLGIHSLLSFFLPRWLGPSSAG